MTAPDAAALGGAVRAIRDKRGLSQVQLADATGFIQAWISHVEHGKRNPSWNNVVRLARAWASACRSWRTGGSLRSSQKVVPSDMTPNI